MSYSRRSRYASRSPSPYRHGRSVSRSLSRSRSRDSSDTENPGNNLYVTGLSPRITKKELENHFASEGKVIDVHLVVDPWTRESRGFGFVTMETVEAAGRCIKYLNRSVMEGRVITVEKARRRRGRTPTPGRYLGLRTVNVRHHSPRYSPDYRRRYSSPRYSSERDRSYSPYYRRRRSYSRSRSPYNRWSRSPIRRRERRSSSRDSYSYYSERSISPYYRRRHYYRSLSRRMSPRRLSSCSVSPQSRKRLWRSNSRSPSPRQRRTSRRSYPRSYSPMLRKSKRSPPDSLSPRRRGYSRESYAHSRGRGSHSGSSSRS